VSPAEPTQQKTIVITGASDGIGLEAASQLARQGHHVALVGRTPAKVEAAWKRIRAESPDVPVETFLCDNTSLADVRGLAHELLAAYPRIDVLVNNAGTVFDKRTVTPDGIEATFQVNHLAGFLLTELLLDRIVASGPARIVTTSSIGHYSGTMDFDDLGFERGYQIMRAYGRSKLANVLHTRHLARRLEGTGVTATVLHPGVVRTAFGREDTGRLLRLMFPLVTPFMKTPEQGAATSIYLASSPEVAGATGAYFANRRPKRSSKLSYDLDLAGRLWDVSAELTGVTEGAR